MTVTQDWQAEYAQLLLGDTTDYSLSTIEGLADHPEVRVSDRTRLRRHGMLPGDDFLAGRSVIMDIEVSGDDDATFAENLEALKLALRMGQSESALTFQVPGVAGGGVRRLLVRPRRLKLPIEQRFFYRLPVVSVEFFATDPRIYENVFSSSSAFLPTAGGGLEFPATFPLTFGAVSTGGTILANNAGNFPTPPSFDILGPCTNPRIENLTTGDVLEFSITLGVGEELSVETDARTVMLNDTASRYHALTRAEWFDLEPGVNELQFRAVTGTAAQLTVGWRSAWL